jgi:Rieske Fe-S protein
MTTTHDQAGQAEKAQDTEDNEDGRLNRRQLIRGAAVAGTVAAAAVGIAACGSSSGGSTSSAPAANNGGGSTGGAAGGSSGGGTTLGKSSDIPVGGGVIFADQKVVVTQPVAGTFKGFSSTCTHLGCQVNKVADGLIQCPCHGSRYSVVDGSVKAGPAPKPLPAANISATGGSIVLNS